MESEQAVEHEFKKGVLFCVTPDAAAARHIGMLKSNYN